MNSAGLTRICVLIALGRRQDVVECRRHDAGQAKSGCVSRIGPPHEEAGTPRERVEV